MGFKGSWDPKAPVNQSKESWERNYQESKVLCKQNTYMLQKALGNKYSGNHWTSGKQRAGNKKII